MPRPKDGLKAAQDAIGAIQSERDREQQQKLGQSLEQIPELIKNENFQEAQAIVQRVLDSNGPAEQRLSAQRACAILISLGLLTLRPPRLQGR